MKENRLVFLEQSPGKNLETQETQKPKEEEDQSKAGKKEEVHDKYDDALPFEETGTCGGDVCKIPKTGESQPKGQEKTELGKEWTKTTVDNVDNIATKGDIVLVGADWCNGCKKAKTELPKEFKTAKLFYVDYDDNSDAANEKFSLNDNLPGKFICEEKGKYKKLS